MGPIYGGVGFFPAIDGGLVVTLDSYACQEGVGIGTDIMLFKSKQIILQPTVKGWSNTKYHIV